MSLPKNTINKKVIDQVDIRKTPFLMFQSHKDDYYNMSQESVRGIQEETILSKVFFSPENVDLIQRRLIREVFKRTNGAYLIEKQFEPDLQIVMRSHFLQNARHVPDHIPEQILELDNLTLDDLIPNVISEINAYIGYLDRAFAPRQIMDLPECVSSAGTRTIPSVTQTFGNYNVSD